MADVGLPLLVVLAGAFALGALAGGIAGAVLVVWWIQRHLAAQRRRWEESKAKGQDTH